MGRFGSFWARYGVPISVGVAVAAGLQITQHHPGGLLIVGAALGVFVSYLVIWVPWLRRLRRELHGAGSEAAARWLVEVPLSVQFRPTTRPGVDGFVVSVLAHEAIPRQEVIALLGSFADAVKDGEVERLIRFENQTPGKGPDSSLN